jgi:recombination protein RecA
MKIGVMFGNPETTTGGNALKFYSSVRIDIRKIASIKDGETMTGSRTRVKVVKNKVAPPFKEAEFDIIYGKGVSRFGELIDIGANTGIIEKTGTWFSYGDVRLGQGRDNSKAFLEENAPIATEIETKIRSHFALDGEAEEVKTVEQPKEEKRGKK